MLHERFQLLSPLLSSPCIMVGDWNATTALIDATTSNRAELIWDWLKEQEQQRTLIDVLLTVGNVQHTRVRGYSGTTRLDRIYATPTAMLLIDPKWGTFSSITGIDRQPLSDHDPVAIRLLPWTPQEQQQQGCHGWNKRAIRTFRKHLEQLFPPQQAVDSPPAALSWAGFF